MTIKKFLAFSIAASFPLLSFADSKASVEGSRMKVIEIQPEASTGLNNIFVVYDSKGCSMTFKTANGYQTKVSRYSNLGGGYAQELTDVERTSTTVTWPLETEDMGYIVEDGSSTYYCWVVNYSHHVMTLNSIQASEQQDCDYSVIDIDGNAEPITYYTINGQPKVLGREIHVEYDSQVFDESIREFVNSPVSKVYESILGTTLSITPPALTATYFTLTGDRFLKEWGMELKAESGLIEPVAVDCKTFATQENMESEEGSNVMHGDSNGLGGSAPAQIYFEAATSDGVIHYEWQMSHNQDFENPEYRFYQKDLDYTFYEEGTFYLRFIGSNSDGTCETYGDVFTVSIGASALECPNAFSPNDDGVNDVWKVSYRSLIDFHCEIFNRNGQKIIGFDDPSSGWDGTWHGRKVKPGVYYYVITATGADGKKYKKSGDINIINSVIYSGGSSSGTETGGLD